MCRTRANTALNAAGFAGSRVYGTQLDASGNLIPFTYGLPVNQTFQAGGSGFSRYETTNPRTPVERGSLFTHLTYDIGDTTSLFFDMLFGVVDAHNLGAARWFNGAQAINVLRRNPYIPAGLAALMDGGAGTADDYASVRLGKHWDDWGRVESHSDNEVSRFVVGAEGAFNDNWTWDTHYQIAYNSRHQSLLRQPINNNFTRALDVVINPANNQPTCAALLSTNPADGIRRCGVPAYQSVRLEPVESRGSRLRARYAARVVQDERVRRRRQRSRRSLRAAGRHDGFRGRRRDSAR